LIQREPDFHLNPPCYIIEEWNPDFLKALPYSRFLQSEYWAWVRDAVIDLDGPQCTLCSRTGSPEVHHLEYINHGYEHLHAEDLVVLCRRCHRRIHRHFGWKPGNDWT